MHKIGFGGGCHWCTEAVFQSLLGVQLVEQGWIAAEDEFTSFSEAVIVTYNPSEIPLQVLIEIHLNTHKSSSYHSMREKYRSAIYFFNPEDKNRIETILNEFQPIFQHKLITLVLPFSAFEPSRESITNYYYSNPKKPFCETFINPKLKLLLESYPKYANINRIGSL